MFIYYLVSLLMPVMRSQGKDKIVPLLNWHYAMKKYWGSGGRVARILDLSSRWR
jgi:hypothetical protein